MYFMQMCTETENIEKASIIGSLNVQNKNCRLAVAFSSWQHSLFLHCIILSIYKGMHRRDTKKEQQQQQQPKKESME